MVFFYVENRKIIVKITSGGIMKIDLIDKDNRPREKIINKGAFYLTDDELLAIMLGSGTKEESILDLSARLIKEYGLKGMFNMNYNDLIKIPGIKEAKASKLLATFEIARRAMKEKDNNIILDKAIDVYNYIKSEYILLTEEVLTIIYVTTKLKVIGRDKFTTNNSSKVNVPYRDIVINAINKNAYGIFMVHNHPGGNIKPSPADIKVLNELKDILKPLEIHLFDSIIIAGDSYYSIAEATNDTNPLNQLKLNRK